MWSSLLLFNENEEASLGNKEVSLLLVQLSGL